MKILLWGVAFAFIGLALVGSANIAGLVAREGLRASNDPQNGTALLLCYFVPIILAMAGAIFVAAR